MLYCKVAEAGGIGRHSQTVAAPSMASTLFMVMPVTVLYLNQRVLNYYRLPELPFEHQFYNILPFQFLQ
jgi:hypothetical protein